ncbi:Hypothetical predicted protein [Xyrichtys novacula]|uniref:Uncharacterized protein n=1 Tax=Xyrichtys novacula TaxID=13765 RepID=A0AAV1H817_XYRNO|nr:Hypothetical predicted protein [Xyrichtys novacula]
MKPELLQLLRRLQLNGREAAAGTVRLAIHLQPNTARAPFPRRSGCTTGHSMSLNVPPPAGASSHTKAVEESRRGDLSAGMLTETPRTSVCSPEDPQQQQQQQQQQRYYAGGNSDMRSQARDRTRKRY